MSQTNIPKENRKLDELKFPPPVRFQPRDRVALKEAIQCGSLHFEAGSEGVVIQDKQTFKMGVLFDGQKKPVFGTENKLRSQQFRVLYKCKLLPQPIPACGEGSDSAMKPMFDEVSFKKGDTVLVAGESGILKEFSSNLQKAHVEIQTAEGPKLKLVPVSDLRSAAEANTYEIGTLLTNAAGECCLVMDGFHELIKLQPMTGTGDNLQPDGDPFTISAADVAIWKNKAYRAGDVVELVDGRYEIIDGMKASDDRDKMTAEEAREFRLGLKYGCGNPVGIIGNPAITSVGTIQTSAIKGKASLHVAHAFTELARLKWEPDDSELAEIVRRFNAEKATLNAQIQTLRDEIATLTAGGSALPTKDAQDGPGLAYDPADTQKRVPSADDSAALAELELIKAEKDELAETNLRLMEGAGKLRAELEDSAKREQAMDAIKVENANLSDKVAALLDKIDTLQKTNQQQAEVLKAQINPRRNIARIGRRVKLTRDFPDEAAPLYTGDEGRLETAPGQSALGFRSERYGSISVTRREGNGQLLYVADYCEPIESEASDTPTPAPTHIANLVINAWSASPDVDPISLITPVAEIEDYAREIPAGWEYLSSYATSAVWEGKLHVTEFVTVRKVGSDD